MAMAAPSLCLAPCPNHAPCLNKNTGACTAKMYFAKYEPQYAQGGYAQGASQGGYAQGASQGDSADAAGYGRHLSSSGGCPRGTEDSNSLHVTHRWPLWTGFALLFAPALYFLCQTSSELMEEKLLEQDRGRGLKLTVAGFICMVASLAYLTMATGNGFITRCCDGRSFYYARYIDWAITTPLMLWELSRLAQDFSHKDHTTEFYYICFLDILMIISGLIGGLICESDKWALFGFSMLCFIPIMKQLCDFDTAEDDNDADIQKQYRNARNITITAWSVYPLIWILSEGTGVMSANGEAIAYTVLDVISKSFFGWVVIKKL